MVFDYNEISFSCIKGCFNEISEEMIKYLQEYFQGWKYSYKELNIKSIYYPSKPSGAGFNKKAVLWKNLDNNSTVLFSKSGDGLHSFLIKYSKLYNRKLFKIIISDIEKSEFPAFFFYYMDAGIIKRCIHNIKEERKWFFYQEGELLDFENESYYTKKKVADRLNEKIITDYLKKLGFNINDENFWKTYDLALYLEEVFKRKMSDEEALEYIRKLTCTNFLF